MSPEIIELLAGGILPPFIDLINSKVANSKVRYVIALLISILVGGLLSINELTIENVLESAAIVFIAAQTVYATYWEKSDPRISLKERLQ